MDVVVELGDYRGRAVVPAEDQGSLGPRCAGGRFSYGPGGDLGGLMCGEMYSAVVFGDKYDLVFRGDLGVSVRVQRDTTVLSAESDHRAALVGREGFAEGRTSEAGLGGEVDLIPPEVQKVCVDDGEARLAAGLGGDARDEVVHGDQPELPTSDHARHPEVLPVADPRYDVVGLLAPVRVVGDGEDGLYHLGVGLGPLGREHENRARPVRVDDLDVVDVDGISRPADHAGASGLAHPGTDLILHLDLVVFGQDGDARAPAALVGLDEFGHDREYLGRPAVDDRVPALDDKRATLAQGRQFLVYASEYDSDEGAENEDAAGRNRQHREQVRPASPISAHVAGIDGPHQVEPERLEETWSLASVLRRQAGQVDEQGTSQDQRNEHQEEPADQRNGTPRDRIVEPVSQPVDERNLTHKTPERPTRRRVCIISFSSGPGRVRCERGAKSPAYRATRERTSPMRSSAVLMFSRELA